MRISNRSSTSIILHYKAVFGLYRKYFLTVKYFQLFGCVLDNAMKNIFFITLSHFLTSQGHIKLINVVKSFVVNRSLLIFPTKIYRVQILISSTIIATKEQKKVNKCCSYNFIVKGIYMKFLDM